MIQISTIYQIQHTEVQNHPTKGHELINLISIVNTTLNEGDAEILENRKITQSTQGFYRSTQNIIYSYEIKYRYSSRCQEQCTKGICQIRYTKKTKNLGVLLIQQNCRKHLRKIQNKTKKILLRSRSKLPLYSP